MQPSTKEQVHVIRLDAHGEHYMLIYTRSQIPALLQTLGRWASSQELAFTWYDAARMSHEMRDW